MAKVVLNSVRLLSMEELCSVALAKRLIVLEAELENSFGSTSQPPPSTGHVRLQTNPQLQRACSYRDALIGRLICCAILQKAVRSKYPLSCDLIAKLVDVINSNSLDVTLSLEALPLGKEPTTSATSGLVKTLANVANVPSGGDNDSVLEAVAASLGISTDVCVALSRGPIELFATISVLSTLINTLCKLSDCVMGLTCESLRINTGFLSYPELQKLPHYIGVARNLIWLTEDSKMIPSSPGNPGHESLVTAYILASGEAQNLSKSIMKSASEMIHVVCSNSGASAVNGIAEKAWMLSLQSHVAGLCRCMTSLVRSYISFLQELVRAFRDVFSEVKDDLDESVKAKLLAPDEAAASASAYESLIKDFDEQLTQLDSQPVVLQHLGGVSTLYCNVVLASASVSGNILSAFEHLRAKSNDKKKGASVSVSRKLPLGHGNLGVSTFMSDFVSEAASRDVNAFHILHESLGDCRLLHHVSKLDSLLVPRNQQLRKLKVPKGTTDILPDDMLVRSIVMDAVRSTFKQHGACEIDTPVFELRETLMGKYGDDQKLIFDLKDSGGEQLSLRYDLTVPFARFLGSNKIEKMKRFHIGKVYRRDEPQMNRGRFREFVQCDLDYAGVYPSMVADAEVIFILIRILRMLLPTCFQVKISHRVVLDAIMNHCGVIKDMHRTISSSIDKLDKEPWSAVRDEMVNEKGLFDVVVDKLKEFVEISGPIAEVVTLLRDRNIDGASEALAEMLLLSEYLSALGVEGHEIVFDLSLARGLDYYTGVIFEAVLTKGSVGSVGAGGRYDDLIGMLSGRPTPAIGMSVGIERIMKVLSPANVSSDITDVFVVTMGGASDLQERLRLCSLLWSNGINATFHYSPKATLRKQLDAATVKQAQMAVIVGKNELDSGVVRVKILDYEGERKGDEFVVSRADMVDTVRRVLLERGDRYSQLEKRVITGMT